MNDDAPSGVNVVHVVAELSLYCHVLLVIFPVDVSVNVTFNGRAPVVGLPVNAATGGCGAAETIVTVNPISKIIINIYKIFFPISINLSIIFINLNC
jgi:hypothetical protein